MPPETPGEHRELRGDFNTHRCCGKSLSGSALVRFDVGQHARRESISKRAQSTTPTSLRFRINELRAVDNDYLRDCDTSPNLLRSLAAILLRWIEHDWRRIHLRSRGRRLNRKS